jgi:transposase
MARDPNAMWAGRDAHEIPVSWEENRRQTMPVLTDAQWTKFEAAIAAVKLRGARPRKEDRRTIDAIIWRLDNGAKWRSIPTELGNWHHAYLRFRCCRRRVGQDHGACGGGRGAETGVCLHRRHRGARISRPPVRGRANRQLELRLNHNTGDDKQALGRSRDGFSSKIVGVCESVMPLADSSTLSGCRAIEVRAGGRVGMANQNIMESAILHRNPSKHGSLGQIHPPHEVMCDSPPNEEPNDRWQNPDRSR